LLLFLSQDDDQKRYELILDLVKRRYDSELARTKDLDSKAGSLIGFVSVVVGLLVGLGTIDLLSKLVKLEYSIPYFLGIGILLLSIVISLFSIKVRKWPFVPSVVPLTNKYFSIPYKLAIKRIAKTMAWAVTVMELKNNGKARLINWSWYLLILGLSFVLLFVIVTTATGNLVMTGNNNKTGASNYIPIKNVT
jgi:hypothetical protein